MANGNDLLSRLLAGRGLPQEEENMSVDPALSASVPEMLERPEEEEIQAPAPIPTAPTKEPAPPVKKQAQQVVEQVEAPDLKKLSESLAKTAEKAEKAEEKVPEKDVEIEQEDLADPATLLKKYNQLKKEFESKSNKAQWMDAVAGIANTVAAQLGTPTVKAASAAKAVQSEYKNKLNALENMYKTAKELKDAKKPKLMQVGAGIYRVNPETGMPELVAGRSPDAEKGMTEYQRRMLEIKEKEAGGKKEEETKELTPGQKRLDAAFAKTTYEPYIASGGFADVDKQIKQLEEVKDLLKKENITGKNAVGLLIPGSTAQNAKQAVEEVVQRNLRLVLGAQFTEKEGERLIARAYNPWASEKENIKRLDRLITQIRTAAEQKTKAAKYFEEHGTLQGFEGSLNAESALDAKEPRDEKVIVEKDGKRFRLPVRQLPQAQKQGYKLVE